VCVKAAHKHVVEIDPLRPPTDLANSGGTSSIPGNIFDRKCFFNLAWKDARRFISSLCNCENLSARQFAFYKKNDTYKSAL